MPDHLTIVPAGERLPEAAARGLSEQDRAALATAVHVLEHSTLVGRLSALAGRPLEILGRSLPVAASEAVSRATEVALRSAMRVALTTLGGDGRLPRIPRLDTLVAAASGAIGGAFGLASLPVELPISTVVMLRAIADIARDEGEDLSDPETGLACLQVFALGSRTDTDDLARGGYFAVRGMLAKSVTEAARLAAARGLADKGAPALARFIGQIAARFGVIVSQKAAAGAVPVLGAIGGGAINAAFVEHFRTVARAHFTVRRLERAHGAEAVTAAYEALGAEPG